jgi:MFS family permease
MWLAVTIFFAFQFILRLVPGVMHDNLLQQYDITTEQFGNILSVYYFSYSIMQIPVGVLLYKFNFRIVTNFCILLCVLGNTAFVFSDNWVMALIGRFMVGAGSAGGFLSVVRVINGFFPQEYRAIMISFSFTVGLVGAIFGATPMTWLLTKVDHKTILFGVSIIGIIISGMIMLPKIEESKNTSENVDDDWLHNLIQVIKNPYIILIGISGGLMVGTLEGFVDVWGFKYFSQIMNLNKIEASYLPSCVYLGMCFGGPILVSTARFIGGSYSIVNVFCGILMASIFAIILYDTSISYIGLQSLMIFLGVLSCYQVLVFALAGELVESNQSSIAISFVNCLNMSFGSFFHKSIATTMNMFWDGSKINDIPIFTHACFVKGLSIIAISCLFGSAGFAILAFMDKNNQKPAS